MAFELPINGQCPQEASVKRLLLMILSSFFTNITLPPALGFGCLLQERKTRIFIIMTYKKALEHRVLRLF